MKHYEWIMLGKDSRKDRKKMLGRIHSHAMRETAASRKRSGTWGKQNQGQCPASFSPAMECATPDFSEALLESSSKYKRREPHSPKKEALTKFISKPSRDSLALSPKLGLPMPLSGLDQLTAETGLNVLNLSALTTVHIGQQATSFLTIQPNRLVDLVNCRNLSYLIHIPTRYGYSYCLDDAVRCVATKARRLLVGSGQGGRTIELKSYCKALRSLQSAIDLEEGWRNADVLCAVEVLCLYEVLERSSSSAWSYHVAGASRLICARGPSNFRTDFEKSLLYSIAGAIICEPALANVPCFLEENLWQQLLRSLAIVGKPFSRRGHIGVNLLCIKAIMPRLLRDVTSIVCGPQNMDLSDRLALITRLQQFRTDLANLYTELDDLSLNSSKMERMIPSDADERSELYGDALSLLIMGSRMLCAVSIDRVRALEDEALTYSDRMVKLERQTTSVNSLASFVLSQKLLIAQATLNTSQVWRKSTSELKIVERSGFKAWCDGIGIHCSFE